MNSWPELQEFQLLAWIAFIVHVVLFRDLFYFQMRIHCFYHESPAGGVSFVLKALDHHSTSLVLWWNFLDLFQNNSVLILGDEGDFLIPPVSIPLSAVLVTGGVCSPYVWEQALWDGCHFQRVTFNLRVILSFQRRMNRLLTEFFARPYLFAKAALALQPMSLQIFFLGLTQLSSESLKMFDSTLCLQKCLQAQNKYLDFCWRFDEEKMFKFSFQSEIYCRVKKRV